MNGKTIIPEKSWQAEQKKLTEYRFTLCEKYYGLKDEMRTVELLRKGTENIISENGQERQKIRERGVEL